MYDHFGSYKAATLVVGFIGPAGRFDCIRMEKKAI